MYTPEAALGWFPGAWATPEKKNKIKKKGSLDSPMKTVLNQILYIYM